MSTITKEFIADTIEGLEHLANSGIQSVYIDMAIAGMRRLLASLEAEAVAYTEKCEITNMQATGLYLRGFPDNSQGRDIALYTVPPAPVSVPDEVLARLEHEANHLTAWHHIDEHSCKVYRRDLLTLVNACHATMLPGDK